MHALDRAVHLGAEPEVMGKHTIGPLLTALGWLVTAAMVLNVAALVYTSFFAGRAAAPSPLVEVANC